MANNEINQHRYPVTTPGQTQPKQKQGKLKPGGTAASASDVDKPETVAARAQLEHHERVIKDSELNFKVVSEAALAIRDQKLFEAAGFDSFEVYCRQRLHLGKSTVNRHICVGQIFKALASAEASTPPTSERQLRPLLRIKAAAGADWKAAVVKVWGDVTQSAAITKQAITEKFVAATAVKLGYVKLPEKIFDFEQVVEKVVAQMWHLHEMTPAESRSTVVARMADCVKQIMETAAQSAESSVVDEADFVKSPESVGPPAEPKRAADIEAKVSLADETGDHDAPPAEDAVAKAAKAFEIQQRRIAKKNYGLELRRKSSRSQAADRGTYRLENAQGKVEFAKAPSDYGYTIREIEAYLQKIEPNRKAG